MKRENNKHVRFQRIGECYSAYSNELETLFAPSKDRNYLDCYIYFALLSDIRVWFITNDVNLRTKAYVLKVKLSDIKLLLNRMENGLDYT